MRVLGIDPGSRYCGFGIVEDAGGTRMRHLGHGVLSLGEERSIEDRLCDLHEGLAREIAAYQPDVVAVEDVFYAKNARSALVLGQARGVAILAAAQSGAKIRSFPPSVIKMAVTGSGRAEKEQVGRMVSVLLGIVIDGRLDASDALAAAICGVLRQHTPDARAVKPRGDWRVQLARQMKAGK
jgi:crossover junction endodeoxyribonuclease RuvC